MSDQTNFDELLNTIESMTVLELSKFVKALEEKFGVSAATFTAPMAAVSVGAETTGSTAEEKSSYTVAIKDTGSNKIQVIKIVKEATGKGLKEAKDLVDQGEAVIKEAVPKEEAEALKKKLQEAGATVELR